jgi:acyl carrier protein
MSLLLEPGAAVTAAEFRDRILRFINDVLPRLDRHGRSYPPVDPATPLFTGGLLDSLSILHLITAIEQLSGRPVPDELVVMKHFRTVDTITATFGPNEKPA